MLRYRSAHTPHPCAISRRRPPGAIGKVGAIAAVVLFVVLMVIWMVENKGFPIKKINEEGPVQVMT